MGTKFGITTENCSRYGDRLHSSTMGTGEHDNTVGMGRKNFISKNS